MSKDLPRARPRGGFPLAPGSAAEYPGPTWETDMHDTLEPAAGIPSGLPLVPAFLTRVGPGPLFGIPAEPDPAMHEAHAEAEGWWRSDWSRFDGPCGDSDPRGGRGVPGPVRFRISATVLHAAISTGTPTFAFRQGGWDGHDYIEGWNAEVRERGRKARYLALEVPDPARRPAPGPSFADVCKALGREVAMADARDLHWLLLHVARTGVRRWTCARDPTRTAFRSRCNPTCPRRRRSKRWRGRSASAFSPPSARGSGGW